MIKQWISQNLFGSTGYLSSERMKKSWFSSHNYMAQYNEILEKTSFLSESVSFGERLYCIMNDISEKKVCSAESCQNHVKFDKYCVGYFNFCSPSCVAKSRQRVIPEKPIFIKKDIDNKEFLENESKTKSIVKISKEYDYDLRDVVALFKKHQIEIKNNGGLKEILGFLKDYPYEMYSENLCVFPEHKLAIQYHNLYDSSFNDIETLDQKRSLASLTDDFYQKGIELLHIFENEWLDERKKRIWESIIVGKFGTNSRIFARKCKIVELSKPKKFFDENHLQGYVPSTFSVGLEYKGEIVAAMSFSKPRFNKNYEWELTRYCCKRHNHVVGGASKLLSHFISAKNPANLVSYADRRYSIGNMYRKLGMEYVGKSSCNYYYFKSNVLYSRIKFQKHKLADVLDIFDPSKTESENVFANGYRRIWDCGNLIFSWKRDQQS